MLLPEYTTCLGWLADVVLPTIPTENRNHASHIGIWDTHTLEDIFQIFYTSVKAGLFLFCRVSDGTLRYGNNDLYALLLLLISKTFFNKNSYSVMITCVTLDRL